MVKIKMIKLDARTNYLPLFVHFITLIISRVKKKISYL